MSCLQSLPRLHKKLASPALIVSIGLLTLFALQFELYGFIPSKYDNGRKIFWEVNDAIKGRQAYAQSVISSTSEKEISATITSANQFGWLPFGIKNTLQNIVIISGSLTAAEFLRLFVLVIGVVKKRVGTLRWCTAIGLLFWICYIWLLSIEQMFLATFDKTNVLLLIYDLCKAVFLLYLVLAVNSYYLRLAKDEKKPKEEITLRAVENEYELIKTTQEEETTEKDTEKDLPPV